MFPRCQIKKVKVDVICITDVIKRKYIQTLGWKLTVQGTSWEIQDVHGIIILKLILGCKHITWNYLAPNRLQCLITAGNLLVS